MASKGYGICCQQGYSCLAQLVSLTPVRYLFIHSYLSIYLCGMRGSSTIVHISVQQQDIVEWVCGSNYDDPVVLQYLSCAGPIHIFLV